MLAERYLALSGRLTGAPRGAIRGPLLGRVFVTRQAGYDRLEQVLRGMGDLIDGAIERLLISRGRLAVAADLAHELQRGGADLLVPDYLIVIPQTNDASAHGVTIRDQQR